MEAKFQFYEIVRVSDSDGNFTEVSGSEGAILGMAEEDGKWFYSVSLFDTGETWNFPETALVSTGKHSRREDYYDGSSAKVVVDKDTGEGTLS